MTTADSSLTQRSEIFFIESNVADYATLIAGLDPALEVHVLDATGDGLAQMADILAGRSGIDAIHLVSHGSAGAVQLGTLTLDEASLQNRQTDLDIIGQSLSNDGDLLLYGCNVAQGKTGIDFIGKLAQATGADVAASDDLTGAAAKGGDWVLETSVGADFIQAAPLSSAIYDELLTIVSYDSNDLNSGSGIYNKTVSSIGFTLSGQDGYSFSNNYGTNYNVFPDSTGNQTGDATKLTIAVASGYTFDLTSFSYYTSLNDTIAVTFTYANNTTVTGTLIATANANITLSNFSAFRDASNNPLTSSANDVTKVVISSANGTGGYDFGTNNFDISDVKAIVTSNATSTVTAGPSGEATAFSTTATSAASAVSLMDFTITDPGTSDGLATNVSAFYANVSGTATSVELAKMSFLLNGPDATNVPGTYDSSTGRITFSGLNLSIADGGSETYTIKAYYNDNTSSNDITDHHSVVLSVNASNFTAVYGDSTFASSQANVTNGSGASIDIAATKLIYSQSPSISVVSGINFTTQPVVIAVDDRGNIDTDFSGSVTLSENGSGSLTGTTSVTAANGAATFSGVKYTSASDADANFVLTASAGSLVSATSASINPDVVATRLVFTTQPVPTAIQNGQSTSFTTVPVVQAVDANGMVDQDYTTNVVLSVTDPDDGTVDGTVNSFTVTSGDQDASNSTVTLTPSGGIATYSGLVIMYTNSGSTNTLALRATSGSLTAVNSSSITATTNSAPVFSNLNGGATYTENGSAVVIDSDVTVADTELDALNSGLGNYNGASITVARNGGASSNDIFGNSGLLGTLTQGQSFTYNGTTVGSVTTNSGGTLTLTFNSNATSAIADAVLQSLTYANSSDDPPTSVTLGWTFNDGSINSSGTNQAVLSITPVNDAPLISNTSVSKTFNEDSAQTFTTADLGFSDVDSGDTLQSITIVTAPGAGELFIDANGNGVRGVGDTLMGDGSVVSAANVGNLTFRPAANANGAGYAAFTWTVSDGTASSANVGTMTLNATAVNDAPTLSSGATVTLTTTNEDNTSSATTVSSLLSNAGYGDVDSGAASGIAITLTSGNGHWQYSTDSGANWFNIGMVSGSSALLLTSTAQVRYVPDGANGETATFAFKAWDQTSGSATTGASTGLADTSTSGGSSAFSNASAQAAMTVTSVNDAPTVGSAISSQSATQDSAFSFLVPAGTFADVDTGDTLALSATLADGSALPAWLSFNPATGTFSGTPGSGDLGTVNIRVTGTDIGNASVSTIFALAINSSNHVPVITSNGGGATASVSVAENTTAVITVTATDADNDLLTYSIAGGADAVKFAINATTGALTFATAPNHEAPTDVGANNTYEVIVRASDGTDTDEQTLTVTVTDVNETVTPPPTPADPLIDGVSVQTTQQTSADGLTTTTVQIDPVSTGRVEDSTTPHTALADIPLVTDATGAALLSTGLPVGIGIQSITQSGNDLTLRQQLINASEPRISDDSAWLQVLSDGIDAYTAGVTAPSQVTVRTLVLSAASGSSAPGQPIVITGASGTGENDSAHPLRQEALIIDARTLPSGSVLLLDQVEFAIIIGPATVTGGAGRNLVLGDGSAQTIILGAEDDILHGGAGDDTVGSHGGNDQLYGDAGNDTVVGGEGNDTLDGGDGNDLLHGGQSDAGTWTFQLNAQHQLVTTFTATTSNLALHASETLTGAWNQGTSALTGYGGITFGDQPVDTLETLTLLCQALLQRFPDVAEMNYWANQGLTPQQLAQLAYNAHLDGQAIATSLTAQSADLITWLWGSDAATSALTQAVADYIEHGGNWADVVLAGIRHDIFRGPLEGTDGTLTLTQSHHSGESGWSSDTGNDTLSGGAGNDTLIGGRGSDILDGGEGIDTAVFSTLRSASQLSWTGDTLRITTGSDTDQLTGIERLQFADRKIALDLDGNAGSAMAFIATVAPQFLDDLTARGLILGLLDNGETLLSLSQRALDLHLVLSNNADLANTLYQHVLDSQPTAEQTQALTSYIEDHGQADFIAAVSGLHLNIDLVGLQQGGVEYV